MALKFTVESFLNLVRQSRLVDAERLEQLVADLPADADSQSVADMLVASGALTEWQVDKLLKGKHKGFFLGKYRLQSLLGKGGMSSVYLAEHVLMRRRCAIKVLPHKKVNDTSYLERFHREAQAVASLDHPNIVRAYDVDREVDGTTEIHFLVMEYVEGHSLQELVADTGPQGFRDVADFIRQSSHGLTHAHEAGLVHRDIKPGNLLVDTEGVVKILDLGLARFFEENDENPITLRHDEKVLGTADYLAPEQALDSHQVDARADIYSLGCTMYFLLTGRPPFNEGTLAQRLMWHQTKEPAAIVETRSDVPGPLADVVAKMMSKDPDDRFQTATEVGEQLSVWLDGGDAATTVPTANPTVAPVAPPVATPVAPPVAAPVAPPVAAPVVPPVAAPVAPPVAAPVEPATPAIDDLMAAETAEIVGSDTESPAAASGDPDLVDFLSSLGEESPAASSGERDVGDEADRTVEKLPPVVEAAVPPSPAPPTAAPVEGEEPPGDFPEFDTSSRVTAARSQPRGRSTVSGRGGSGLGIKIGLGVVALVVIVAIVMASLGGDDGDAGGNSDGAATGGSDTTGGGKGGADKDGGDGGQVAPPQVAKAKRTLEVGPDAEFKTIAAALNHIREHKSGYRETSRRVQATINVLGGQTYAESVEIDGMSQKWPTGIEIVSTGAEPAVIAPPGQKPGIQLAHVEHIRISGFKIAVEGKPSGVVLIGVQDRVQLEDLRISGFTKSGVDAQGVAGDPSQDVLQMTGLFLKAGSPEAVGLKFSAGPYDTNTHIRIHKCRVIGPVRAGLELTEHAVDLTVQQSMVQAAKAAILFSGKNRRWRNITIQNNTFVDVGRGLVFSHMPMDSSDNVTIRRNLFFQVSGPECLVENNYVELQFSQMFSTAGAIGDNWSTRTEAADVKKGERELMLPGLKRQRGVSVEFSSTDPTVSDFLEPRTGSLPRRGAGDSKNPAFIGAQPFLKR